MFLVLSLTVSTGILSSFAQEGSEEDPVWSVVQTDPTTAGNYDPNYKWDQPIQEIKYLFPQGGSGITVYPNFRPHPGANTTQSEMSVDVHPFDEDVVFGSANSTNWPVTTLYGTGVYWSLDGAQNWTGFDNPPFGSNSGDPVSIIGPNGYFYENYITNSLGQAIAVSTNNGTNWSTYTVAPNPGSVADKNHMMVDKKVGSPYENRLYCAWTDFGGVNDYDAVVRYSTNFGVNWSASINLSNTLASYLNQGVNVQTGPNGEVYATWAVYIDGSVGTGEDGIGFSKSTDGGLTWSAPVYAYQATNFGIRGTFSNKSGIRVSSFPSMAVDRTGGPNNGTIYICWPQDDVSPAGSDPDIVMIKSTNGGTSWTSPIRINDDPINNGKDQYFPWMTVDQSNGRVVMVWYDSRETTNDSAGVFMAHSTDGGSTFINFKVSDQNFKPKPIPGLAGGYQGDYIGVASLNDVAYPLWSDDRTGNYQGWMSVVEFSAPCPVEAASNPNPSNGAVDVPISLAQLTWTNGAGAVTNETYFGTSPGSLSLVQSGTLATSWNVAGPLAYSSTYYWRIVEVGDTCTSAGPIWSFTTEADPNIVIDTLYCDAFESGLSGWTITNDGGTCIWENLFPPFPNTYTLPATATGGLLAADSDECGSGTTMLTTATLNQVFDFTQYTEEVWIEFDNDWRIYDAQDEAHVEVSTNGGSTWTGIWDYVGTSVRNTNEVVDLTFLNNQSTVTFRFRSVQPGWDWWWVIDNLCICGVYIVPVELTSFTAHAINDGVELNWTTATETNNQGFEVERKSANGEFEKAGYVAGFGTTTEPRSYSFADIKLSSGIYTYRLKQIDFDGSFSYSTEVNVDVTTPIEYALEQNYPNPFNPSTTIKYSIPEDGFVKLSVYNLLGEEVTTLVNNVQKAGRYEVVFDASSLASGIYVYRLESSNFSASRKLMLMK
jgi:hypothetical protein